MEFTGKLFTPSQLRLLEVIFAKGAEDASRTLSKWLRGGIRLTVDEVQEVPVQEATEILGITDAILTACVMGLRGRWTGKLLIAFEDESGRALVDMLLGRPLGTCAVWGEMEQSAAAETANILGCAYLNSLNSHMPSRTAESSELYPTPPVVLQDYASSLIEASLMEQAMVSDQVLLIRTQFTRDATQLSWHLLFVPDPGALSEIIDALDS
ncbi:MAG: chemotaxis protein CheC [Planctomycetota bacterium]